MLKGSPPPRISLETKRVLQLSKQSKVGDRYLYQNHTEIRIYGCQLAPYKLPKYLPMRLFALEYYRQIMKSDEINFVLTNKISQFKVKNQLVHFICNSREAGKEADQILQQMKFQKSFMSRYDPQEFMTRLRKKAKLGPYIHHPIAEIERYANQSKWVESTLVDRDSTKVDVENALCDIERQFDESLFLQVPE